MSRFMSLADGLVTGAAETGGVKEILNVTGFPPLRDVERDYFLAVLESVGGHKGKAAAILGITVKSVYNKLYVYGGQGFGPYAIDTTTVGSV